MFLQGGQVMHDIQLTTDELRTLHRALREAMWSQRARILSSPDDEAATHEFNTMKILLDRIHTHGLEPAGKVPADWAAVGGGDDD
jgi:hypothetical protein